MSLSQTLTHVRNLHWVVVEDSAQKTELVKNLLEDSGVKYTHLNVKTQTTDAVIPEEMGSKCETIHVSTVCMGKCGRDMVSAMLKSLLFHAHNPVHFHLIVDDATEDIVNKLFDTWNLPDVKHTCYNGMKYSQRVSWIPNSHYSGIYTLIKLLIPEILPKSMKRVIIMDTDMTILSDIAELWNMFRNMTHEQLIGLVDNQSDWYLKGPLWPAIGRGYNTGLMLLRLLNIYTKTVWSNLWRETAKENLKTLGRISLGDQDIINVVIKKNPHIVYNISCYYNVQMNTAKSSYLCHGGHPSLAKIVHWNSDIKYAISSPDASYFRSFHHRFINLDSNLLGGKLRRCWSTEANNNTSIARGVKQRNAALDWLQSHLASVEDKQGVVYFMDDDNKYSLKVFDEIRKVAKVGVWPVGSAVEVRDEMQLVTNGKRACSAWLKHPFCVCDLAGFAINTTTFLKRPFARFSIKEPTDHQESVFLKHFITLDELEPLAENCTKVYVAHKKRKSSTIR